MTKVFVSAVIQASLDRVWEKVRDFNSLPQWHPGFSRSHIEEGRPADQVGCVRNFDIAGGGGTIRERLLALSDTEHSFTYTIIDSPLAVEDYVATLTLYPVTATDTTLGVWTASFKVAGGSEAELLERVGERTFGGAFRALNEFFGRLPGSAASSVT